MKYPKKLCFLRSFIFLACVPISLIFLTEFAIQRKAFAEIGSSGAAVYPGRTPSEPLHAPTCLREQVLANSPEYRYPDPDTDPTFPLSQTKAAYRPPIFLIDLQSLDPNSFISPSFTFGEFMNRKDGRYALFSALVVSQIQKMQDSLPREMGILSGYRPPAMNRKLKRAARWSRHLYGDAIDFRVRGIKQKTLAQICLQYGAAYYQLYPDHVHCDWRHFPQDPNFFPALSESHVETFGTTEALKLAEFHAQQAILSSAQIRRVGARPPQFRVDIVSEDEGTHLIEWSVTDPNGVTREVLAETLKLKGPRGRYYIRANLGGNLSLETVFDK